MRLTAESLEALTVSEPTQVPASRKTDTVVSESSDSPQLTPTTSNASLTSSESTTRKSPPRLPSAKSLPGHWELLHETPPYTLLICTPHSNTVTIECNHASTVMLFVDYFKGVGTNAFYDSFLQIDLLRSFFFQSHLKTTAEVVTTGAGMVATLQGSTTFTGMASILTFAEKVCGYRMVPEACNIGVGGGYYFKREEAFLN